MLKQNENTKQYEAFYNWENFNYRVERKTREDKSSILLFVASDLNIICSYLLEIIVVSLITDKLYLWFLCSLMKTYSITRGVRKEDSKLSFRNYVQIEIEMPK